MKRKYNYDDDCFRNKKSTNNCSSLKISDCNYESNRNKRSLEILSEYDTTTKKMKKQHTHEWKQKNNGPWICYCGKMVYSEKPPRWFTML